MDTGSMLIQNYLKKTTLLLIDNGVAKARPPDNCLNDARAELNRIESSPSPIPAQIAFITEWISYYVKQQELEATLAPVVANIQSSLSS